MNSSPAFPKTQLESAGTSLLLREVTHRIANQYMMAIASVSLAAARTQDRAAKAILTQVSDQLRHYAIAHRALQPPDSADLADLAEYLHNLGKALTRTILCGRGVRLIIASDSMFLAPDICWRLGLILTELATNAARHAFSNSEGAIRIEAIATSNRVRILFSDDGRPASTPTPGRGTAIVEELVAGLGGYVAWRFRADGTFVLLSFPRPGGDAYIAGS